MFTRHPANPILTPGEQLWRRACVFNPGVLLDDDGKFYLWERAAGQLRPFHCYIGLHESEDGVNFRLVSEEPVFTPEQAGCAFGSVQDPRVVKLDGTYYMTYAYRPYAWSSHPTGVGVPESHESEFLGIPSPPQVSYQGSKNVVGGRPDNLTRSGIAVSQDRLHWEHLCWATPEDTDDRDVILFPEKISGRYVMLRRPLHWVGEAYGTPGPSMWISFSDDLHTWTDTQLLAKPEFPWEDNRIGGSTPPLRTEAGWLVFYHGVQTLDASVKRVVYRMGALLLDSDDPTKVIGRTREPLMEPEAYYERFGLYIPNVIFPTGNVLKDGLIYLYYGVCDTAIALATAPLSTVLEALQ